MSILRQQKHLALFSELPVTWSWVMIHANGNRSAVNHWVRIGMYHDSQHPCEQTCWVCCRERQWGRIVSTVGINAVSTETFWVLTTSSYCFKPSHLASVLAGLDWDTVGWHSTTRRRRWCNEIAGRSPLRHQQSGRRDTVDSGRHTGVVCGRETRHFR